MPWPVSPRRTWRRGWDQVDATPGRTRRRSAPTPRATRYHRQVTGDGAAKSIEELLEDGVVGDALHLLPRLPLGGALSGDALDALRRILARATPDELLRFESDGRSEYGWWFPWHGLDPRQLIHAAPAIRMLATFHPNGYVREGAVRALRGESDALPFLLLRLNDWVEPVAASARQAVEECLTSASAAAILRCMPIVERLRSTRRRDVHAIVDSIERSMGQPSALLALREVFIAEPAFVRRACVRYAGRQTSENAISLLVPLTADGDPVVASRATKALIRILPATSVPSTLGPLLRSRVGTVRLLALNALVASGAGDLDGALRRAALDATAAVRELARHELARKGPVDFVALYGAALRSDERDTLVPALSGLRECGSKVDSYLVVPFVAHRSARVRAAAVRAIGKLDPDARVSSLAGALEDPSPRVVRLARDALRGRGHLLESSRLQSLLDASSPWTAVAALALLGEGGVLGGARGCLTGGALGAHRRPRRSRPHDRDAGRTAGLRAPDEPRCNRSHGRRCSGERPAPSGEQARRADDGGARDALKDASLHRVGLPPPMLPKTDAGRERFQRVCSENFERLTVACR